MIPGIDAGNFRFKIAVPDGMGNPQILTNRLGEPFIRSVVYFAEDGSILVGTEAENTALANPKRAVFDWKRFMGTDAVLYQDGKDKVKAKDILTILLKKVKETIEAKTGEVCEEVVITDPANYNDLQKKETLEAASDAGLKVLLLLHEPTAAALGNEFHKKKNSKAIVFDLGGGTFDVSMVQNKGNLCEVIATNGEPKLGGRDFNDCLSEFVLEQFEAEHGYRPNPEDHPVFCQDMAQRVEQLKLSLTANTQSQIVLSCDGDLLKTTITRKQFNNRVRLLVQKAMERTAKTAKDANLAWSDIDEVYAVGGGSMPPIITEELEKLTGKKVSCRCEAHAAAAMGAVIAGRLEYARLGREYKIQAGTLPPPDFYLRDILSRPIGVAVLDDDQKEKCSVLLRKDTPIPSIQTRLFKMTEPNQTEVLIRILDGEDGANASGCVELGRFVLKGLPPRPDLIGRIEITFNLDASGMLTATARDIVSGKTAELQITYMNKADPT
jgi:molecular chaperone DnaK